MEVQRSAVDIHTESDAAGTFTHDDEGMTGEANNQYRCRLVTPYVTGNWTGYAVAWGGPAQPSIQSVDANGGQEYTVTWANGMSAQTEVSDSLPSELEPDVLDNLRYTASAGQTSWGSGVISGSSGLEPYVGVRHKVTNYGVDDFSEVSSMVVDEPM